MDIERAVRWMNKALWRGQDDWRATIGRNWPVVVSVAAECFLTRAEAIAIGEKLERDATPDARACPDQVGCRSYVHATIEATNGSIAVDGSGTSQREVGVFVQHNSGRGSGVTLKASALRELATACLRAVGEMEPPAR